MARPLGLVGLGLLGSAIAARLRAAGENLLGYDIHPERRDEFVAAGSIAALSVAELFAECEIVLLSLPTSDIVRAVLRTGDRSLRPGQLLIDTTTGHPDEMERLGGQLAERGIFYIDATVAGSSRQVRLGEAIVMAGGSPEAIEQARPILRTFAKELFSVGPVGAGARMKLVVNLALGLQRAVLAEALQFAAAMGVSPSLALQVLRASPAASQVMETKGAKMLQGEFAPEARLAQHLKDVRLILETGEVAGAKLPLSGLHAELLQSLVEAGLGELDNSVVIRAFDRLSSEGAPAAAGQDSRLKDRGTP